MTNEEKRKLTPPSPFSEEAIERTDGRTTGGRLPYKGIKYKCVVNRLNEVLGIGSYRAQPNRDREGDADGEGRSCVAQYDGVARARATASLKHLS